MKWQRAKIIDRNNSHFGWLIWVRAERPVETRARDIMTLEVCASEPRLRTNIVAFNPRGIMIATRHVELLPLFADDLSLISWDEYVQTHEVAPCPRS